MIDFLITVAFLIVIVALIWFDDGRSGGGPHP